jgi:hypothetical protein
MRLRSRNGDYISCPIVFPLLEGLTLCDMLTIPKSNLVNGNVVGSGGVNSITSKNNGINPFTNTCGFLLTFNCCEKNDQGIWMESCEVYKNSNVNHMIVCWKYMRKWNHWSLWHKTSQKQSLSNFGMEFRTRNFGVKCKMLCYSNPHNPH